MAGSKDITIISIYQPRYYYASALSRALEHDNETKLIQGDNF